ncbi:MAG: hypothetical protein ACUBOA_13750 [Candidatus Loosdrechtia sp.]|uniref:hypothetical protein n=1 Tax=Candidatus Loosdrechtia sp. TaxID=3101272 RepID=UPI003A7717E2|nr:MAG: hypothetical protein QY305_14565 [Candidatus Jettenia sp. AMX2]
MLKIVDEIPFFHDEKTKEKFLLVLGALSVRLISLRKAAEIMELEEALLEIMEILGFEFSYLEEKDIEVERNESQRNRK